MVFYCFSGDVSNIAISESESFGLTDSRGRNWICHPVDDFDPTGETENAIALQILSAQQKAKQHGLSREGTKFHGIRCERGELVARISELP